MPAPTFSTEVEAVNVLLSTIGAKPVATITGSVALTTSKARTTLQEVNREVQGRGWHFNSETDYPFAVAADGTIPVGSNVARWDAIPGSVDIVRRGPRLYDRGNRTFTFESEVCAQVVFYLPWDELTEACRQYITVRAARKFCAREAPDDAGLYRFTEMDEADALADLMNEESANRDSNFLTSPTRLVQRPSFRR